MERWVEHLLDQSEQESDQQNWQAVRALRDEVLGFPRQRRRVSIAVSSLDPEELKGSYQEVCAGAVSRFDGHVAKYLGDGLLVYFGHPHAHEDDAQRAVRAGLAILQDMGELNSRLNTEKGWS